MFINWIQMNIPYKKRSSKMKWQKKEESERIKYAEKIQSKTGCYYVFSKSWQSSLYIKEYDLELHYKQFRPHLHVDLIFDQCCRNENRYIDRRILLLDAIATIVWFDFFFRCVRYGIENCFIVYVCIRQ